MHTSFVYTFANYTIGACIYPNQDSEIEYALINLHIVILSAIAVSNSTANVTLLFHTVGRWRSLNRSKVEMGPTS